MNRGADQPSLNPLREGISIRAVPQPCTIVIFGATGDLTHRKLIPALYNLAHEKHLSPNFAIVGFAREDYTPEFYREQLTKDLPEFLGEPLDADLWDWFLKRIYYLSGDFRDPACYQKLKEMIAKADAEHHTQGNHFFYLIEASSKTRADIKLWRSVSIRSTRNRAPVATASFIWPLLQTNSNQF